MTSPATPAPDSKKQNRKNTFFSALAGVGLGVISMASAAAITAISAGGVGIGVPFLVILSSAFAFDFVLHYARTDEFKLLPALGAAAVTAGAIGFAFNVAANRMHEQELKKQHQSAPVGMTITRDFDRAAVPVQHGTISFAEATHRMHTAPKPAAPAA